MIKDTLLSIHQLSKRFGGIHALQNINLDVAQNSITSLIGPNGAGKTTLFNCITGFYQADSGDIVFYAENPISIHTIIGQPFRIRHLWNWKEGLSVLYYKMFGGSHLVAQYGIARTFQNVRLFKEMSVIENLLVALNPKMNRNLLAGLFKTHSYQKKFHKAITIAYRWLEYFNLAEDANRLAGELPYGKQRHLEIARSLCLEPKLLCLDEPAAGLNTIEKKHLSELIVQLKKEHKLSILLIEHDVAMVMQISDQIYVLDHGEIISSGTPQVIRNDPKVIEAYLGMPQKKTNPQSPSDTRENASAKKAYSFF